MLLAAENCFVRPNMAGSVRAKAFEYLLGYDGAGLRLKKIM